MVEFILYISDQNKSKIFYQSILKKSPVLDVPGMTEFLLNENCKLGLMPENSIAKILMNTVPHPDTGNGIPRCELYIHVDNPEEYICRALESGAKMISPLEIRDWGDSAGYVADPDGHILVFAKKKK